MNSTSATFEPLGLPDLQRLSATTIYNIAWDLADAKQGAIDTERLRGMLGSIPLARAEPSTGSTVRFDLNLSAKLMNVWDGASLPELFAKFNADLARANNVLFHSHAMADRDFGPMVGYFGLRALAAKAAGDEEGFSTMVERSLFLVSDPAKAIESQMRTPYSDNLHGCLGKIGEMLGACNVMIQPYRFKTNDLPPLSMALALAAQGDHRVLDALLARPEIKARMGALFTEPSDHRKHANCKEFIVLESAEFWKNAPEVASKLLAAAQKCGPQTGGTILPWAVAKAMIESSGLDPRHPSFALAEKIRGDELFAPMDGGASGPLEAGRALTKLCEADPTCIRFAKPWAAKSFDPKIYGLGTQIDRASSGILYRMALFASAPHFREAAMQGMSQARGPEFDPFKESLRMEVVHQHIEAISKCQRPDTVPMALDAMGLAGAQAFPGHRKGLDLSLLMWLAQKTERVDIFEAALDWFGAQGGLREQAEAKAWVYRGRDTTKKGDLLAQCIAVGKTDFARALLEREPSLEVKSAREVAKAMSQKVRGDEGSHALSSFEDLLLRRVLEAKAKERPPEPVRKARSL